MTDFLSLAAEVGFSHCAPLCMAAAVPRREVRGMCAADRCGKWGRCWSCPPACGTLEQAASRIARFDRGILVQSTAKLADDFDYDGIQALSRTHARRFAALARQMRLLCTRTLPLSAGPCLVCRRCTCPDRPCRYPSRRISAMEAYGLLVSDVCVRSGLAYNYGPGTMTYTSCILYSEE